MYTNVFKRIETKYLIDIDTYNKLLIYLKDYTIEDNYSQSHIYNIYFDTDNYYLIRRSLEKPIYKEKLRIRTYELKDNLNEVFIEIKKKYRKVVYKKRCLIKYSYINKIILNLETCNNKQILGEISYFFKRYPGLKPKMYISYDRYSLISKDDKSLRITFDTNIKYREYDLFFKNNNEGSLLIDKNKVLMEVKSSETFPLWLVSFLSNNRIYPTSFSKYGKAYLCVINKEVNNGTI